MFFRILVVAFLFASPAFAAKDPNSTQSMREFCLETRKPVKTKDFQVSAFCLGRVDGAARAFQTINGISPQAIAFCIPNKATTGQLVEIFLKYTDEKPKDWHYYWIENFIYSMLDAYPCKK